MIFSPLKPPTPPIAVDFGVSRLKVLQLAPCREGEAPALLAAAACATPPDLADKPATRLEHQAAALADILKSSAFRGRRAVCSVSSTHALVQHLQVNKQDGRSPESQVREELARITGRDASQFILRLVDAGEVSRGGAKRTEIICLAIPREAVLAHMKALRHARLDAVGIHAEHIALVKGYESLASAAEGAHLLIDLGDATTKIAVALNGALRLAKVLPIGGRHLFRKEQAPAQPAKARSALRAQLQALEMSEAGVSLMDEPSEHSARALDPAAADALADEVAQCLRYFQALVPDAGVADTTFLGGGAARTEVCKRLARALGVPARVADPLNAFPHHPAARIEGVDLSAPSPEWAVAVGLCSLPTEA